MNGKIESFQNNFEMTWYWDILDLYMYFRLMIHKLLHTFISLFFIPVLLWSQFDKEPETCGHALSAAKWLNTESTLTENQEKIDVAYYRIDLEIDIDAEEIDGSVLVNGWIGNCG